MSGERRGLAGRKLRNTQVWDVIRKEPGYTFGFCANGLPCWPFKRVTLVYRSGRWVCTECAYGRAAIAQDGREEGAR